MFKATKQATSPGLSMGFAYPWVLNFDFVRELLGWNNQIEDIYAICAMLKTTIENHKANLDQNYPKDFIDMMLIEMKTEDPSSSFHGAKGEDGLLLNLFEIFAAGTDTTSSTLTWAVLYMLMNPEVEEQVQQEIDRVVGRDRLPKVSDRLKMPFTEVHSVFC